MWFGEGVRSWAIPATPRGPICRRDRVNGPAGTAAYLKTVPTDTRQSLTSDSRMGPERPLWSVRRTGPIGAFWCAGRSRRRTFVATCKPCSGKNPAGSVEGDAYRNRGEHARPSTTRQPAPARGPRPQTGLPDRSRRSQPGGTAPGPRARGQRTHKSPGACAQHRRGPRHVAEVPGDGVRSPPRKPGEDPGLGRGPAGGVDSSRGGGARDPGARPARAPARRSAGSSRGRWRPRTRKRGCPCPSGWSRSAPDSARSFPECGWEAEASRAVRFQSMARAVLASYRVG